MSARLMQRQIWAGQKLFADKAHYNTAWRFNFETAVDPLVFEQAFLSVVARIDALRMVAKERQGSIEMHLLPGLAGEHVHQRSDTVDALVSDTAKRPFDISKETCRSVLIEAGPDKWVWVLNQHHIANDATSGHIIFTQTAAAYAALKAGDTPATDPLPPFSEFAATEIDRIQPEAQAFWKSWSKTAPSAPVLYNQNSAQPGVAAIERLLLLSRARMNGLAELLKRKEFAALGKQQGIVASLQTLLMAWISRVSGDQRAAIGIVTHGRTTPQARQMVGCLIDIFPLDVELEEPETFASLHLKTRERSFAVLRHALPGSYEAARTPRFNVIFNSFRIADHVFDGAPVGVEWLNTGATDPNHALRLNVVEDAKTGEITLKFLFHRALFDDVAADNALNHYLALLDACIAAPDDKITDVALAEPTEASHRLLKHVETHANVEDVVSAVLRLGTENPNAPVVHDPEVSLSRAELIAQAKQVAGHLLASGVVPGDRIGLHLRRSVDLVTGFLGILFAGAAAVPLDPAQPRKRLSAIAREAGLKRVLTGSGLVSDWGDATTLDIKDAAQANPAELVDATHAPAYVIFTSGSTGTPKGVVVGRLALSRYAAWANRNFAGDMPSTWALHSAIGFDLTITSIFAPLVSGGAIRAYPDAPDGPNLAVLDVFAEDNVDVVKLTPRHLSMVLQSPKPVNRIRALVLGGEALQTNLATATLRDLRPDMAIYNEYGPTEATVGCMIHRFDPEADTEATVPIGTPAEDTRIYVLDTGLNPVPDGVTGEIYIAGTDRLAEGYLNRPEETAERFLPDPFHKGARMYRSGDFAYVAPDGVIHYLGRRDDQVKVSGVRIEPGEIEAALDLRRAPQKDIRHCTTCGIGDDVPDITVGADGICSLCSDFSGYSTRAAAYFRDLPELQELVNSAHAKRQGKYDCVVLLSGGKDSTYALCRMAELTPPR